MSVQVKRRREAAGFLSTFIGAQAELIVDTTNNRVQVHDGVTPGGWPVARLNDNAVALSGGTIDGIAIGNTTPAAGSFSSVSVNDGIPGNTPAALGTALYISTNGEGLVEGIYDHYSGSVSTVPATANLVFRGARGTPSAPSAVQSGDRIGGFGARAYGTSGFSTTNRANLNFLATENWTDTAQGTSFVVSVTSNGTTTGNNAFRVDSTGYVGIGTATPQCELDVNGPVKSASYTVATLPSASAALAGARAYVTDAASPTFLGALTGGGTIGCSVFCNGTAWCAG